jgi:WD40 repeat protein
MEKTFKYKHLSDLKGHQSGIYALMQGDEIDELISSGGDGMVIAWKISENSTSKILVGLKEVIFSMIKTPEKGVYLFGTMNGTIYKLNRESKELTKKGNAHSNGVFDMLFLNDNLIASIGGDGMLRTWDYPSFHPVHEVLVSDKKLRSLDLNKELAHLAIGAIDGTVSIIDVKNLKRIMRFKAHDRGVYLTRYHPHRKMLITGCIDGTLNFWKTDQDYKHIYQRQIHDSTIYGFDHHKEEDMYVTVSKDKSIKIWDPSFDVPKTINKFNGAGHVHSVNAICWMYNGILASAGDDKVIKLWDIQAED